MKTAINLIICLWVITLLSCNNNKAQHPENTERASLAKEFAAPTESTTSGKQLFAIESAYIKFLTTAAGQEMYREWRFDQYGNRQYEENYMTIMGQKTGDTKIVVDGFQYSWNYDANEGSKSKYYQTVTDYNTISEKDIARYGIARHGYEEILGKKCLKVTVEKPVKSTIWVWNGIALKTVSEIAGNTIKLEAVELHEGAIDDAFFILPEGVTFPDAN